jgi:hypothetical protein
MCLSNDMLKIRNCSQSIDAHQAHCALFYRVTSALNSVTCVEENGYMSYYEIHVATGQRRLMRRQPLDPNAPVSTPASGAKAASAAAAVATSASAASSPLALPPPPSPQPPPPPPPRAGVSEAGRKR